MKTTDVSRFSAWMLAALIGLAVAACEDEKKPEEVVAGPTGPLTVSSLISDPKVGEPGDTLLLTAVVTSTAPNEGDFPVMDWSATGGSFVEDDKQTVRWVAPNSSGFFTITAKATNHVNSATGKITLFIGAGGELLTEFAGQVDLINGGPDFHYFRTTDVTRGIDVYQYVAGVSSDAILPGTPPQPGLNLNPAYSADGSMVAWAADTLQFGATVRPRNIYVGDFGSGTYSRFTVDGAKPGSAERNRYDMPSFSPNKQVVAYQRLAQSWDGIAPDSFHVYIHDLIANKRTLVSYPYKFPRAFFPTFSTDGDWLVYVADTSRTGSWELYASPMTGNSVDGSIAALKKFTFTGGLIVSGGPRDVKRPPMAWNPVSSVLAIAGGDNSLHLVQTTPTGANDIIVPEVVRTPEMIWSPDGSLLAATFTVTGTGGETWSRIVTVTPAGVVTERENSPVGDSVRDLAFSPDANWLLYRVTRGGGAWFNALDLAGGALTGPVPVTAVEPAGNAGLYRGTMTLRPAWTDLNLMIYPSFNGNASNTPGIYTRDLSGLAD